MLEYQCIPYLAQILTRLEDPEAMYTSSELKHTVLREDRKGEVGKMGGRKGRGGRGTEKGEGEEERGQGGREEFERGTRSGGSEREGERRIRMGGQEGRGRKRKPDVRSVARTGDGGVEGGGDRL